MDILSEMLERLFFSVSGVNRFADDTRVAAPALVFVATPGWRVGGRRAEAQDVWLLGTNTNVLGHGDAYSIGFKTMSSVTHPFFANLPSRERVFSTDIAGMFRRVVAEFEMKRPGSNLGIDALSKVLFIDCVRALSLSSETYRSPLRDQTVFRAIELIHKHPEQAWTAERLARKCSVSRSVLFRKFSSRVGVGPSEYLRQWRIIRAQNYLRDGSLSIMEIAFAVGYENSASFSRAFKAEVGLAPMFWRTANASGQPGAV